MIYSSEILMHGRYMPTMVYVREDAKLHTRLCLYNYYSELFPDVQCGARVLMRFFNQEGEEIAEREEKIGFQGQLHYDVSRIQKQFEGIAAVSLVPDNPIPVNHNRMIGTGYYVCYFDDQGHMDCSHEWEAMSFQKTTSAPWLCVVRPHLFPASEIIVMSNYYGRDLSGAVSEWIMKLRDERGQVLAEKHMQPIPTMGSRRLLLKDVFPEVDQYARARNAVAVEVSGTNIQGPFTFVTIPSGDFNIHHFC